MSETQLTSAPRRPGARARALIGRDGTVRGWDPELETVWERSAAQAIGCHIRQLLLPLEQPQLPDLEELRVGLPWHGIVGLIAGSTRPPKPCLAEFVAVGDDSLELTLGPLPRGDSKGALTASHDDVQRLHAILEHMPGFCYTIDNNFVFTSSAGAGLAPLNLAPGQIVGQNLLELWGTREPTYEPLVCHLKALAGLPSVYQDVCLGRSLEYRLGPLEDAAGNIVGAIGVGVDVTDRERAREEHAKLTAQLRQSQKMEAVGRLAGSVAHDFNNYLTCIMGNLSLLEDQLQLGREGNEYLAEANAAIDSAAAVTRQLLAFSRKQPVGALPINLSSLVARISGILERLVGHRIQLRLECASDLWHAQADPGQLEQALVNLVVNARDAIAEDGQIVISTHNLDLSQADAQPRFSLTAGEYVVLSVRDSGRGLSDVVRAKLFEPFFTTKQAGQGTGLGLAMVHGAVQQSGGAIRVDSELGVGSTFYIFLPRARVQPADAGEAPPSQRTRDIIGGTETILLVNDEPSVLELAHCTLQQLGYNVLPCASPDEALRTFGLYQNRVELLVTEVGMPRMNGKELASRISALAPGVAVLFSSDGDEVDLGPPGLDATGPNVISKPYRPRELAAKVRELLDRRG
jgi:signal transduction histidine kinase